jgi:alpha-L-rhamnosidase
MSTEPARQYVFRLSLNGSVLGVGPVRPPDPAAGTEYSAWDVTSALRSGSDTFGALAYTASNRRFELELIVQYQDGSRQVWGSGTNWQGLDGGAAYPAAGSISPSIMPRPSRTSTPSVTRSASTPPATSRPEPRAGPRPSRRRPCPA